MAWASTALADDANAALDAIGKSFDAVTRAIESATQLSEPSERESRLREAISSFQSTVRAPLDTLISGFGEPKDDVAREQRDRAELARMRFLLLFANVLPEAREERQKSLEEGLELATFFFENRAYFPIMQYEAAIQKGLFLLELERYAEAADVLSILYEVTPAVSGPLPPALITAIKDIRLKALLFGARGRNGAGEYATALRDITTYFKNVPAKSPFSFAGAESDSALGRYVILLKLEEGIALAGTGEAKKGLDVIHAVIAEQEARGESGAPFVTDARVALAKIESAGLAGLTGRELYQVALGKLSQSRGKPELIEEALRAFQRAIMTLDPADITTYAPRCLDQIGQLHYMLGRYEEAALVFREIVEFFPSSEDIGKAATNYLASVNLARNARSEHGVLATMFDEGQKFVARFGDGDSFPELQARMAEAQRARDEGRYSEAAEIYGSVPRERDGKKVPFYFRARFSSWWMHVLDFESNASEEAKARFAEAIADIEGSLEEALAEKDLLGAAVGSFAVGQMRFHLDEHAKAVEALSIFLDGGALEEDTYVRCEALGYLVGSAAQVDDSKAFEEAFRELFMTCSEHPALGYAALTLSDHFSNGAQPDPKRAAGYMDVYVRSKVFEADIARLRGTDLTETYLRVARVLTEGGFLTEAKKYTDLAESSAEPGELERQLLYIRALAAEQRGEWATVIKELGQYREKYRAQGAHYEDPYVWRKLGIAYFNIDPANAKKPANLKNCVSCLGVAAAILERAVRANPEDEALSKQYFSWALDWIKVKRRLAAATQSRGDLEEIDLYINNWKHTDMGGRRDEFLKLQASVQNALKRK